ncbi:hypothetical protein KW795_01120 [Candidatus Microgenomates bacterium]|nr:hypothetical protein [Candidatus Microgenomates bacterium]
MSARPRYNLKRLQSGQALLIVLLSMAVILTIVLSVLSSTTSDVSVTSKEEEAQRAFSAAEAGIEQALLSGTATGSTQLGQSNFALSVSTVSENSKIFEYPQAILSGDVATTWFVAHDDNGNLVCSESKPCFKGDRVKVCWGKVGSSASDAQAPAIEATILYLSTPGNLSTAKIAREAIDPYSSRISTNKFSQAVNSNCTIGSTTYAFQKTLIFSDLGIPSSSYNEENGLQYMGLKFLYNSVTAHSIGVDVNFSGSTALPSQGSKIDSVGKAGESTRKIEVYNLYRSMPPVFNNSIFSYGGISQ